MCVLSYPFTEKKNPKALSLRFLKQLARKDPSSAGPLQGSGAGRAGFPGRGGGMGAPRRVPNSCASPHGFLDGSARPPTRLALLRPSLSAEINEVPRGDLPGPPSNSAASGLAHANSSFLVFPGVGVGWGGGCWLRVASSCCRVGEPLSAPSPSVAHPGSASLLRSQALSRG